MIKSNQKPPEKAVFGLKSYLPNLGGLFFDQHSRQ